MTVETVAPAQVRFPVPIYQIGRLVFGLGGAAITLAIIILAFHCAPIHKKIFQAVQYDTNPPFGLGLDHHLLGLFQKETGGPFRAVRRGAARSLRGIRRQEPAEALRPEGGMADQSPERTPLRDRDHPGIGRAGRRRRSRGWTVRGGRREPSRVGCPFDDGDRLRVIEVRSEPPIRIESGRARRITPLMAIREPFFPLGIALELHQLESRLGCRPGRDRGIHPIDRDLARRRLEDIEWCPARAILPDASRSSSGIGGRPRDRGRV